MHDKHSERHACHKMKISRACKLTSKHLGTSTPLLARSTIIRRESEDVCTRLLADLLDSQRRSMSLREVKLFGEFPIFLKAHGATVQRLLGIRAPHMPIFFHQQPSPPVITLHWIKPRATKITIARDLKRSNDRPTFSFNRRKHWQDKCTR